MTTPKTWTGHEFPKPGWQITGNGTVVASVSCHEAEAEDEGDEFWVILLHGEEPHYRVGKLKQAQNNEWEVVWLEEHTNIVSAVETYKQIGGDY